jgi:hypothetical protein
LKRRTAFAVAESSDSRLFRVVFGNVTVRPPRTSHLLPQNEKAARPFRLARQSYSLLITSGLLGSGVGHFFLVRFPGGFIAHKKLPWYDFLLTGSYAECVAIRNLGAAKRLLIITHDPISPWVKKVWLKMGSMQAGISTTFPFCWSNYTIQRV